ncbi:MAG: hypothetical protein AMS25_18210 [Gemmatimonas sp. SM23_52]|jgi:uncharacterized integral membrane protein|nr:MAG: hypothetical protein AMS25_18210 [Gemmatimonas sp. SM23_52]
MTRAREIVLIVLTAAIIVFAAQNVSAVDVVFLAWQFPISVALIALVPLLAGLVVGSASAAVLIRRRRRLAEERRAQEAELEAEAEGEGVVAEDAPERANTGT